MLLKIVILAESVLGVRLSPDQVRRRGITGLSVEDVARAPRNGHRWKLVGEAKLGAGGAVDAGVSPHRLPHSHPLAAIGGATNAVTFETDYLGQVTVSGPGAGRVETGFALLSDIAAIHRRAAG